MCEAISPKLFLALAALLMVSAISYGQAGSLDPTFGTDGMFLSRAPLDNTSSSTHMQAMVEDPHTGNLIGLVRAMNDPQTFRGALVRISSDGVLDETFGDAGYVYLQWTAANPGIATDLGIQYVSGIPMLIVGGGCGGSSCIRIERRSMADGSLDPSFGGGDGIVISNASWFVTGDMEVLSNGKILFGGGGTYPLVRFHADGSPDASFGPNGVSKTKPVMSISKLKELQNGKVIAVGSISAGTSYNFGIVRYDATGKIDTTFGSAGKVSIDFAKMTDLPTDVAIDSQGRIVVCGTATYTKTNPETIGRDAVVVRLTPNGQLDGTFGNGGKAGRVDIEQGMDVFTAVAILPGDAVAVAGEGRRVDTISDILTARYTASGVLDGTYSEDGLQLLDISGDRDSPQTLRVQFTLDGPKLLVGGSAGDGNPAAAYHVVLRYLL